MMRPLAAALERVLWQTDFYSEDPSMPWTVETCTRATGVGKCLACECDLQLHSTTSGHAIPSYRAHRSLT